MVHERGAGHASIGDAARDGDSYVIVESVKRNLTAAFDEASGDVVGLPRKAVRIEAE
jgi:hypothetical protein